MSQTEPIREIYPADKTHDLPPQQISFLSVMVEPTTLDFSPKDVDEEGEEDGGEDDWLDEGDKDVEGDEMLCSAKNGDPNAGWIIPFDISQDLMGDVPIYTPAQQAAIELRSILAPPNNNGRIVLNQQELQRIEQLLRQAGIDNARLALEHHPGSIFSWFPYSNTGYTVNEESTTPSPPSSVLGPSRFVVIRDLNGQEVVRVRR